MKIKKHLNRWRKWNKKCTNSWIYKLFVLCGIIKSPTMACVLTKEEEEEQKIKEIIEECIEVVKAGGIDE